MNGLNQMFRAEEGASAGTSIIYHRIAIAERKREHLVPAAQLVPESRSLRL